MLDVDLLGEAGRQLTICNACRYCEGLCPVFKAVETRRVFHEKEVFYLANLCHDCRACFYACMYTPPHEFGINIPSLMANGRIESYRRWSWPRLMARSFKNQSITLWLGGLSAAAVIVFSLLLIPPRQLFARHVGPGAFYELIPYAVMVIPALLLFIYGITVWIKGGRKFWSDVHVEPTARADMAASLTTVSDVLKLRHLDGGGPGCSYPGESPSSIRRLFHSFTFYGFLFALLSTTCAFIYQDYLHRLPPYSLFSVPVILGTIGGVGLIIGITGLLWLKTKSDSASASPQSVKMDYVFLGTLGLTALTGMLTLALRDTPALGSMLVLHLASIAALFVTAPYGKFVHGVYRLLAVLQYATESKLRT